MKNEVFADCLNHYQKKEKTPFWGNLAEKYGYKSGEALRSEFRHEKERRGIPSKKAVEEHPEVKSDPESFPYSESYEQREDGTVISDRLILICSEELKNPKSVLAAHGFDPSEWDVVSYKHNMWHGMRPKDQGLRILYQSKITVKPKEIGISFEKIDEFFQNFQPKTQSVAFPPSSGFFGKKSLEIDLADLHTGNAGLHNDTPMEELRGKFTYTIDDICTRIANRDLNQIYLVPLGDLMHFDTPTRTTTGGTPLESAGYDFSRIFDDTLSMLIYGVDQLIKFAPVQIPYIAGNHDKVLGYTLIKALEAYYRNNPFVMIDSSHLPRKFRRIGNALVGWCHGDMPKTTIGTWLQSEAREEWGRTQISEVHAGHFHSQQGTTEKNGTIVRYLPSMTETDMWTYQKGFVGNVKSTVSFLWDHDDGLQEMWFTNM